MDSIVYSSTTGFATALHDKEVSSREVVEAHLEGNVVEAHLEGNIEVNPALNAVVSFVPERAMEEAHSADDALAKGNRRGLSTVFQ